MKQKYKERESRRVRGKKKCCIATVSATNLVLVWVISGFYYLFIYNNISKEMVIIIILNFYH